MVFSLAHTCLLALVKSQPCDSENPVIADQLFDVERNRMENYKLIDGLKKNIKKLKKKTNALSCLKTVNLNVDRVIRIQDKIAYELFDQYTWYKVETKLQASWKEYFHGLYDLIVGGYENDHSGNIIFAREVIRYHDVFECPKPLDYNDRMYPLVESINDLFDKLKREQVITSDKLHNIKYTCLDLQRDITSIQHDIIDLKCEKKKLEQENNLYFQIIKWSMK